MFGKTNNSFSLSTLYQSEIINAHNLGYLIPFCISRSFKNNVKNYIKESNLKFKNISFPPWKCFSGGGKHVMSRQEQMYAQWDMAVGEQVVME